MKPLLLALCVTLVLGGELRQKPNAPYGDYCKEKRRCQFNSNIVMSDKTETSTTMEHRLINGTFAIFADTLFQAQPSEKYTDNVKLLNFALYNATEDLCRGDLCWMHIRKESKYDFAHGMGGYYEQIDDVLYLHLKIEFEYPPHSDVTDYIISMETCMINPDTRQNHCLDGSGGKGVALRRVRSFPASIAETARTKQIDKLSQFQSKYLSNA